MTSSPAPASAAPGADLRLGPLSELASGVYACYISGHGRLDPAFVERLQRTRQLAEAVHAPMGLCLGEVTFGLAPHGWGRYRYLACHEVGRIGFSTPGHLPVVRVQPRAELLHAVGPAAAVAGFSELLAECCTELSLSVNRVDLFADWQGWELDGTHRERFACRAGALRSFEDGGAFTGFEFGSRTSKTFCARIYDKTAEIAHSGADWWPAVWGDAYQSGERVLRVEFEVGRQALGEFGLDSPERVLAGTGDLWSYATGEWLTYRAPGGGVNPSRRPIAPEWRQVQAASLAGAAVGLRRVLAGRHAGSLRRLFPGLVGYLAGFAVAVGTADIEDTLVALDGQLRNDEIARRTRFAERVERRRTEGALR
jgi:hypothetical protein